MLFKDNMTIIIFTVKIGSGEYYLYYILRGEISNSGLTRFILEQPEVL